MDVIVSMTLPDAETQALLSQAQSKARQLRSLLALPVVQQRSQDQLLEENKSLRKSLQHVPFPCIRRGIQLLSSGCIDATETGGMYRGT